MKNYLQSPLPFQGQKNRFLKEFKNVLKELPKEVTIVDLFGGSGLLSHAAKQEKPHATVIYNDYDNFSKRLSMVDQTNKLFQKIRSVTKNLERDKLIPNEYKKQILEIVKNEEIEVGYVDYITLSSSLLFSASYVINYEQLVKERFFNKIRHSDFVIEDYLNGVEIVNEDYKELFKKYKYSNNVIFLVDPPYLSTNCKTYTSNSYWKLKDYLHVLDVLVGTSYFYFTSNKSQIVELCMWMEDRTTITEVNPFSGSTTITIDKSINKISKYTDMMLYKLK